MQLGRAVPLMASALSTAHCRAESRSWWSGNAAPPDTTALWQAAHRTFRPFAVSVMVDPKRQDSLAAHMPWVAAMKMIDGRATAYVCRNFTCEAPFTDPGGFQGARGA